MRMVKHANRMQFIKSAQQDDTENRMACRQLQVPLKSRLKIPSKNKSKCCYKPLSSDHFLNALIEYLGISLKESHKK